MPTAVVTGAGRGIGRALGSGLSPGGYSVVLVARTPADAEPLAAELERDGGSVPGWPDDPVAT